MTEGKSPRSASAPDMTLSIRESAANWWLRAEAAPADRLLAQELECWLAADDRHRLAYAELACLDGALAQLRTEDFATAPGWTRAEPTRLPPRSTWRWMAQAFGVLVLATLGWWWLPEWIDDWRSDLRTAVGEIRTQTLVDGSVLTLDSDSAVSLRWSDSRRELRLWRGVLHVQVARDPLRPLTVHSGGLSARAIGTAFSVDATRREVRVDAGRVQVRLAGWPDTALDAGQAARVLGDGWQRETISVQAPDWSRGQRIYQSVTLREVLIDLDRYLPQRLWLRASPVLEQPISAVLDLGDPARALRQLCAAHGLAVQHWPGVLVIGPS